MQIKHRRYCMKSQAWKIAGMAVALTGSVAMAQEGGTTNAPPTVKTQKPSQEEMLKRFDADGDGQLNEAEKAAMQEAMQDQREPGRPGARRDARPTREEMMKRFDTDGDGQLNEAERAALQEAMRGQRGGSGGPQGNRPGREEMMKRFDADGDGVLSEAERKAMRAERDRLRAENRKRFDADGDGQLSEEERATMRETLRAERPTPPQGQAAPPLERPAPQPE
jgi:Ca2+-binding EF-hand superfamily protein